MEKLTNSSFEPGSSGTSVSRPGCGYSISASAAAKVIRHPRNGGGRRGAVRDTLRFTITVNGDPGKSKRIRPVHSRSARRRTSRSRSTPTEVAKLYVNGKLEAATREELTLTPSSLGKTGNNWIGRSQFRDPFFKGSFNEFRIYNTTLSPEEVEASFKLGPDKVAPAAASDKK